MDTFKKFEERKPHARILKGKEKQKAINDFMFWLKGRWPSEIHHSGKLEFGALKEFADSPKRLRRAAGKTVHVVEYDKRRPKKRETLIEWLKRHRVFHDQPTRGVKDEDRGDGRKGIPQSKAT